ncbi:OmpH family outer membrane protein [Blattabacterium cuenoti]|uniref:OmpH family outer membrane protein n=1 Tax=Blattabacterium cuenoti TaxID=1653831 RepID=UPI001EEAFEF0|nr:OmpH family outer membrane protein [Blattabacterium cuenoti]
MIFYYLLFFIFFNIIGIQGYSKECSQRIVCLNSTILVEKMPEFSTAKKELEKLTKSHENTLEKLVKEFHNKSKRFQRNRNPVLKRELEVFQARVHAYQKKAAEDLAKRQEQLLNPLSKKIDNAIHKVMDRNKNILRVDDCSPGKGVLVNKGIDITEEVKKELGI